MSDIGHMRREYQGRSLDPANAEVDPMRLFARWFDQAQADNAGPWYEPNVMNLATVDAHGLPDARIVLLKQFDETGLVFYTNYHSAKGLQLARCPHGAAVFHWVNLQRQVRFRGVVDQVDRQTTEQYWSTRPRGSQLGSAVSTQSQPVGSRIELERMMDELDRAHRQGPIPCPENWGGYRLIPSSVEFWQGQANRLHDRLLYQLRTDEHGDRWAITRLAP